MRQPYKDGKPVCEPWSGYYIIPRFQWYQLSKYQEKIKIQGGDYTRWAIDLIEAFQQGPKMPMVSNVIEEIVEKPATSVASAASSAGWSSGFPFRSITNPLRIPLIMIKLLILYSV